MGKIFISGLRARGTIGVTDEERKNPQQIIIDVELEVDTDKSAKSDKLGDTLDYDRLARQITSFVEHSQFHLLERLASQILGQCLAYPIVTAAIVTVKKPSALADAEFVSVTVGSSR